MGCFNSIVVNAAPDEVWAVLKDFHNLSWAKNVVSKLESVGSKSAHEIGAQKFLMMLFMKP